jgi:hypothetical protein
MDGVFDAFVMYSAGVDQEAIDVAPGNAQNSLFIDRLIPRLASPGMSLIDVVKGVQVDVEQAAVAANGKQLPVYFDGIRGQYYLAQLNDQGLSSVGDLSPSARNVVRLGGFATWDGDCRARPSPRIKVSSPLRAGRVLLRFENVTVGGSHFGKGCDKAVMRGLGVYYVADDQNLENAPVESVAFSVHHWSTAPATVVNELFEIDPKTSVVRRLTEVKQASANRR